MTRSMRNYRLGLIVTLIIMVLVLVFSATKANANGSNHPSNSQWSSVTMREGDYFEGVIFPNTLRSKTFRATSLVKYKTYSINGVYQYTRILQVQNITSFEGAHMGCGGDEVFANGHRESRITWYFKDDRGHNFTKKVVLPCNSSTYSNKTWNITTNAPRLYGRAQWKAVWVIDVAGQGDRHGESSGYFRKR